MTEWDEFRRLDMRKIKSNLRNTLIEPTLIDLRNLYNPKLISKFGILYVSVGRPTLKLMHLIPPEITRNLLFLEEKS